MNEEKHQKMTEKRKAGHEKKKSKATKEKGLVVINTGTGKGKTSAAFGMLVRAIGHQKNCAVVQFIKGAMDSAERDVLSQFDNVEWHTIGDGFTWNTQDRQKDMDTAQRAWSEAERIILDPAYDYVVLDELNVVLKYDYIALEPVLEALRNRGEMKHVIITGRHAPKELVELADLVSEIRPTKHPFKEQGIKAQAGIEF